MNGMREYPSYTLGAKKDNKFQKLQSFGVNVRNSTLSRFYAAKKKKKKKNRSGPPVINFSNLG